MMKLHWAGLIYGLAVWLAGKGCGAAGAPGVAQERYEEELRIRPLDNKFVLLSFVFDVVLEAPGGGTPILESPHQSLLPRQLSQILQDAHTRELHLRFARGRWEYEKWGRLPVNGSNTGGSGAEIWAVVADDDAPGRADREARLFARWRSLVKSLAGMTCSSLNFIDRSVTHMPQLAFGGSQANNSRLFHGMLPQESVCTENLTPFLKLLPCKGRAGLSYMLDGHRLFGSQWHSLSTDVVPLDREGLRLRFSQRVDAVFDADRSLATEAVSGRSGETYIEERRRDSCEHVPLGTDCLLYPPQPKTIPLSKITGKLVQKPCPIAARSEIIVEGRDENPHYPVSGLLESAEPASDVAFQTARLGNGPASLVVDRSMTGFGGERGGIALNIRNMVAEQLSVVYHEELPWFVRPYLHTLRVTVNGTEVKDTSTVVAGIYTLPLIDRVRGTHLEMHLLIQPHDTVQLHWDFDKAILRYTEYPPDANRGFDIPAAIFTILDDESRGIESYRTMPLLLAVPTPDFSMPYNVIIFTSTLIALAFGRIFNSLSREFISAEAYQARHGGRRPRRSILRLIDKLKGEASG